MRTLNYSQQGIELYIELLVTVIFSLTQLTVTLNILVICINRLAPGIIQVETRQSLKARYHSYVVMFINKAEQPTTRNEGNAHRNLTTTRYNVLSGMWSHSVSQAVQILCFLWHTHGDRLFFNFGLLWQRSKCTKTPFISYSCISDFGHACLKK